MKSTAILRHLRIAPRKVRMVSDLIRRKKVEDAQSILRFAIKKGSAPILKLLNSAVAGAKHNFNAKEDNLYVSKITVDEGPKLKRMRPRAKGQGYEIHKKTSHITIVVDEITPAEGSKAGVAEVRLQQSVEVGLQRRELQPFKRDGEIKVKPREVRGIQRIFRRKAI